MLSRAEVAAAIDHSLLKNFATEKEVIEFCRKSLSYGMGGICIFPVWTKLAARIAKRKARIVTVIGYPTGMSLTETKVFEAVRALKDGADELDMVQNVSALKSRKYDLVRKDIEAVVKVAHSAGKKVKVILETALLTDEEKIKACKLALAAKADFIKTSTGFVGGATIKDVRLIKRVVGNKAGIKAAGGIRSLKQTLALLRAGATRIGTSTGFTILNEFK